VKLAAMIIDISFDMRDATSQARAAGSLEQFDIHGD
jgi:hypothetical protein